jgi:transcriptional regulator with XRE-family HTH domain
MSLRPPAGDSQVQRFATVLKQLLRARGLRYAELGHRLGVSPSTVKRWLAGNRMTLDVADDLCRLAGLSFEEVVALSNRDHDGRQARLSLEQETELARDYRLALVFYLLLNGWGPQEIQGEFDIPETVMVGHLTRLDRLRVLDLLPGNRVRLLVRADLDWRRDGPLRRLFEKSVKRLFVTMDFADPAALWRSDVVRLSPAGVAQLEDRLRAFQLELRELTRADRKSARPDERALLSVLLAARPFEVEAIREPLRGAPAAARARQRA